MILFYLWKLKDGMTLVKNLKLKLHLNLPAKKYDSVVLLALLQKGQIIITTP